MPIKPIQRICLPLLAPTLHHKRKLRRIFKAKILGHRAKQSLPHKLWRLIFVLDPVLSEAAVSRILSLFKGILVGKVKICAGSHCAFGELSFHLGGADYVVVVVCILYACLVEDGLHGAGLSFGFCVLFGLGNIGLVDDVSKHENFAFVAEDVRQTKDFALLVCCILYTAEVATLGRCIVSDIGLLLLVDLTGIDNLFHSSGRYQTEYFDVTDLTHSISTILSLKIPTWVPVWIEDHDLVCRSDVETHTASSCTDEEDKLGLVGVEIINGVCAIFVLHTPIKI
ncbi:DNA excision repair protein, partial [Aureobasidium sp. EXF-3399]